MEHAEDGLSAFGCETSQDVWSLDQWAAGAVRLPELSWCSQLTSVWWRVWGWGSAPGEFGYAQDTSALEKRSAGRLQPSVLRGRRLTSTATCSSADAVKAVRSMPLGK